MMPNSNENYTPERGAIGIAAVLDPVHYPALVSALNALWDLPTTPVRRSCMDALVVMIDDFEAQQTSLLRGASR